MSSSPPHYVWLSEIRMEATYGRYDDDALIELPQRASYRRLVSRRCEVLDDTAVRAAALDDA